MSSAEELEIAEARMNNARPALLDYCLKGYRSTGINYRRLVVRVMKAQAAFLSACSELGDGQYAK